MAIVCAASLAVSKDMEVGLHFTDAQFVNNTGSLDSNNKRMFPQLLCITRETGKNDAKEV